MGKLNGQKMCVENVRRNALNRSGACKAAAAAAAVAALVAVADLVAGAAGQWAGLKLPVVHNAELA